MRAFVALCFFLVAGASQACVTAKDLARGIVVTYADGRSETHRRVDRTLVRIERRIGGGITRWALAHGIYYVALTRLENGRRRPEMGYTVTYPLPRASLPVPDGPMRWSAETRLTLPPDPPLPQSERFVFGRVGTLSVGDCKYRAQRVQNETRGGGDKSTIDTLFLPDIGTSLFLNVDGNPDAVIAAIKASP